MATTLVRLVNQFDPPERRATVATATCCCCCCCCCVVSMVGTTTFMAINLPASAKAHGQKSATGRALGAGFALCIFLPVIGAALALASLGNGATGTGNVFLFCIIALVVLGGILSGLYAWTGEKHPVIAGFSVAAIGAVVSVGEAFLVLWGVFASPVSGLVFVVYVILVSGGVALAVYLGDRVKWPSY